MKKSTSTISLTFCYILLFVFLVIYFWDPVENGDVWWHLATGRWIIEKGQVPRSDIFALDQTGPWILTQWLGSVFYYLFGLLGGCLGLKILRVILCMLPLVLVLFHYRRKIPPLGILFLVYLLALSLHTRCMLRPFLLNFTFVPALLILLLNFRKTGQAKYLIPVPLLGMLWNNIHMGSFVYGGVILGCFFVERLVGLLLGLNRKEKEFLNAARSFKGMGVVLILYMMFFLINPYGLKGALHPIKVFLLSDYIHFPHLSTHIKELLPPDYLFTWHGLWVVALLAGAIAVLILNKRRNWPLVIIGLISLVLFIRSQRGSVFFAIMMVFIIGEHWPQDFMSRLGLMLSERKITKNVLVGIWVLLLIPGIIHKTRQYTIKDGVAHSILTQTVAYGPQDAVAFLQRHRLYGRVFCDDQTGNFLLWCCYPKLKPFIDSRQVDFKTYYGYFEAINDQELFWESGARAHYGLQIALLNSDMPSYRLIPYFIKRRDWQLIYVEGNYMIFVKKDSFLLPEDVLARPEHWKAAEFEQQDFERLRVLTTRGPRPAWMRWFHPSAMYFDLVEEGVGLLDAGLEQEAIKRFIEAMKIDPLTVRERVSM